MAISDALFAVGSRVVPGNGNGSAPKSAERIDSAPAGEEDAPQQTTLNVMQVPDAMWQRSEESLVEWIERELNLCESERGEMIRKFARWKEAYDAPLATSPKNFPIYNASNITSPIIKEHVHTIVGQLVQSTIPINPPFVFEDTAPEWENFVDPVEDFITLAVDRELDLNNATQQAAIEMAILGTAIVESYHDVDERHIYSYTADGSGVYPRTVVYHDGPKNRHIPLGSAWIRMHEKDPNTSRWFGLRLLMSEMELREKEAQGKFYGIDRIRKFYEDRAKESEDREAEDRLLEQTQLTTDRFEIFKLFVSYDIDNDNRYEELVLYFHRESRTFIGRTFLPYWHGKRGFSKKDFFPRTDRFYGEGLAEMLESIQLAISATANRRADNATMANLKMLIKRKMIKSIQQGDPLYTGKIIDVNDIWNDIRELSLSDIYPSTVSEEQIWRATGERLSGMNEGAAGAAMPVSRTTAAAQLALLQEQRNRIGLTISALKELRQECIRFDMSLYAQFGTNGKALAWMGERGRYVEAIFRLPKRVAELGLAIRASSPTSSQNKQLKRENMIAMFNLITQMYERLLPLVQALAPDGIAEVAHALVKSARKFMQQAIETMEEIADPSEILEGLVVLERILPKPEDLGGRDAFERAAQTAEINDGITRIQALLREAEDTRSGNVAVRAGDERAGRPPPPQGPPGRGNGSGIFGGDTLFRS